MSTTGMMQRCWEHDYRAPSFYLITLVTEPRRGCLGVLQGTASGPLLKLSPIGDVVRDVWRRTSAIYPGVEACECVLMPDHFHGILWVKERLARPMGHIVKAFKRVSTQECGSKGLLLPPDPSRGLLLPPAPETLPEAAPGPVPAAAPGPVPAAAPGPVPAAAPAAGCSTLWPDGFQDSILLRKGQLKAMVNYLADNPRRLIAKRANPELFTVVADQHLGSEHVCPVIGNRYLLQYPLKRQVQISRRITPEALATQKEELLYASEHGAVLVSPGISPGEKEIAHAALEAGRPLIVLLENGFPPLYKPAARYFRACAGGRLLMIAPFPYHRQRRTITRDQCLTLNTWARTIAKMDTGIAEDAAP